jgi:hypothetical protein
MDRLAEEIADFTPGSRSPTPKVLSAPPRPCLHPWSRIWCRSANVPCCRIRASGSIGLEAWTRARWQALIPMIERRRRNGYVRECHGDMHRGNIALVDGEIRIFDAIEFNPALRWIDTASEIAFLIMDLEESGATPLARRFLNRYLERSGDYGLSGLLDFYKVYRALGSGEGHGDPSRAGRSGSGTRGPRALHLHPLSGACRILHSPPFASSVDRLRPLRIRKELHGLPASRGTAPDPSALGRRAQAALRHLRDRSTRASLDAGIYFPTATEWTYGRLLRLRMRSWATVTTSWWMRPSSAGAERRCAFGHWRTAWRPGRDPGARCARWMCCVSASSVAVRREPGRLGCRCAGSGASTLGPANPWRARSARARSSSIPVARRRSLAEILARSSSRPSSRCGRLPRMSATPASISRPPGRRARSPVSRKTSTP